jgi:uncharacterized membrane protein YozB (DUF420 family)
MVQTRTEAALLVVQLQRSALGQGLVYYGVAAIAAMSFVVAAVVLIAVALPPPWNAIVLALLAGVLLVSALFGVSRGNARLQRDAALIADFSRGLKLDLAMINLALKDPATEDEEELAERERAKKAVREAAAAKAATPSTAEGTDRPSADGPTMNAATGAIRAAGPAPDSPLEGGAYASEPSPATATDQRLPDEVTEREMPQGTPPESVTGVTPPARERSHGST